METNEHNSGIDLPAVRESYIKLMSIGDVAAALQAATTQLIFNLKIAHLDSFESMRVVVILLEVLFMHWQYSFTESSDTQNDQAKYFYVRKM